MAMAALLDEVSLPTNIVGCDTTFLATLPLRTNALTLCKEAGPALRCLRGEDLHAAGPRILAPVRCLICNALDRAVSGALEKDT